MELPDDYILSSDAVRGLVVTELRRLGENELADVAEVVGPRLTDVMNIWGINGDTIHDNANLDASNQETMHKRCADVVSEKAMLKMLPDDIVKAHLDGSLHIHDREYFFTRQFCFDSDLRYILYYGLYPDGTGRTLPVARAARSAEVAFLHAAKALGSSQCNCAGGQGYQAFNVFIAPYLAGKSYDEIKQLAQMFVFEMGQMTAARGAQAVFSSIQLFPGVPSIWKDKPVVMQGQIWDGTEQRAPYRIVPFPKTNKLEFIKKTYGEFERETRLLFRAFMEVFYEGDSRGRPFSFPKPEIVIGRDFLDSENYDKIIKVPDWESTWKMNLPTYRELYRLAFKLALKNGAPYFESQYNISNPLESISCVQCCAYGFSSDSSNDAQFTNKLNFRDGAHFDSLGSMQVVSLNLPRAAYITLEDIKFWDIDKEKQDEFKLNFSVANLKILIDKAVKIFNIKRDAMSKQASPFMRQTPIDPNDQSKRAPPYCDMTKLSFVVGVVGLNEYVQILTGKQLHESEEAIQLGERLLGSLNLYCGKVGHENDMTIALARTPAETTAQRFAVSDLLHDLKAEESWGVRKYVKGNVQSAVESLKMGFKDVPIEYSNGTHCAVDAPISIQRKAEIEGRFFDILKGGNIFHVWLGDLSPFYTLDTICDENARRIPKEPTGQDIDHVMEFGLNLAKNTPITYFAFSKDMTICMDCNATSCGIHEKCPRCGSIKVDHEARITGYLSSVSGWNEAKKEELKMRHRTDIGELTG